jgi:fatty acid desaturase
MVIRSITTKAWRWQHQNLVERRQTEGAVDELMFATFVFGLGVAAVTAVTIALTVPLPLLVLSYAACFVIGFSLGHWQRQNEP